MAFDFSYFLYVGPAMLLALWAQYRVKHTYHKATQVSTRAGLSGAEVAEQILVANGLSQSVIIEETAGKLTDHYDPRNKTLRLSSEVFHGRSVAAFGIAAHEVGHALQHAKGYAPLTLRNAVVPMASIGSNMAFVFFLIGMLLNSVGMFVIGVALFSLAVIFQLINLPVEFDASNRAKKILVERGLITSEEYPLVKDVLGAAAMTYVAATLTAVMTLVYYLSFFRQVRE